MEIIYIIFGLTLGYFMFDKDRVALQRFKEYIASPSTGKPELDWVTRQIFKLFNRNLSERWYEARVHLHQGVFKSLICAFGFIYLVRIDLIDDNQEKGECRVFAFHGFQSLEDVLKKTEPMIVPFIEETNAGLEGQAKMHYYSTFVAGYNVVATFMDPRL